MTDELVDDISIIIANCKHTAKTIGEAYILLNGGTRIVKMESQPLRSIVLEHSDNNPSFLANLVTNFRIRGPDGQFQGLGHLETTLGPLAVPKWWPMTPKIYAKYGLPRRGNFEIIIDAYLVDSYFYNKITEKIVDLPMFPAF